MSPSGYISLLYSVSKKPLEYWRKHQSQTGTIRKIWDPNLLENVVEIQDLQKSSISNTFITCPPLPKQLLDIKLPFLVIIMKNMNVECRFRVQIIDNDQNRHHFYFSNESFEPDAATIKTQVRVKLESGWNRVEIDLRDLTQRAFESLYKATQRLEFSANCRLRRVYFVDRHYNDVDISAELCQGFFNHYVIKRRIFPRPKLYCDKNEDSNSKIMKKTMRANFSQFIRDLEIKSAALINDFFATNNKSGIEKVAEFKRKMRMMIFFGRNYERIAKKALENSLAHFQDKKAANICKQEIKSCLKKPAMKTTENRKSEDDKNSLEGSHNRVRAISGPEKPKMKKKNILERG